jgi:CRP/FNR family cyclic AMP-dependent transcriptional regulator
MKLTHLGLTRNQFQVLQYSQLFHGLTDEQLHAAANHWHVKKYNDPTVLLLEGHSGDSVFMILEGRAKIYCTDSSGREMAIGYKGSGEMLGEMGFIDGTARSATVETMTPSILLQTDRDAFQECCRETPIIFENLLKIITTQLRVTNARLQVLLAPNASCRVARLLVQIIPNADVSGNIVVLPFKLSQTDIGAMAGLSRASANAVFAKWKRQGFISIDVHHCISIHDFAALKREAE